MRAEDKILDRQHRGGWPNAKWNSRISRLTVPESVA
jgi:hypothetical protein